MICPICQTLIEDPAARACPLCAYAFSEEDLEEVSLVGPSYANEETEEETDPGEPDAGDDTDSLPGFDVRDQSEEPPTAPPQEALILGDFDENGPPSVVKTGAHLLYATGSSSSMLQPWAVPAVVGGPVEHTLTPLETAAFKLIDGKRNARDIQKLSGLKKSDVEGALLTLLDRGAIRLASTLPPLPNQGSEELVYPSEMTEEDLGEGSEEPLEVEEEPAVELRPIEPEKRDDTLKILLPVKTPAKAEEAPTKNETPPKEAPKEQSRRGAKPEKPPEKPALPDMDLRARKLILQAEKDRDAGDYAQAHTNLKLAVTFDPKNAALQKLVEKMAKDMPRGDRAKAPAKSITKSVLDAATEKESAGQIDQAIEILERALKTGKEAAIFNRLGVILATRKKDFARGRELVEKALELAPDNEAYRHNLHKILSHAATVDLQKPKAAKADGGGLFGLFGKKK